MLAAAGYGRVVLSELAQARDLLGGGDTAAALKLLERARRRALSRQDQSGLRDVVALAGPIAGSGAEGRQQRAAGRIVYAARRTSASSSAAPRSARQWRRRARRRSARWSRRCSSTCSSAGRGCSSP